MRTALLGKKIGMTQVYLDDGSLIPVTVIQAGPCAVLQVKQTGDRDGYDSVQLGFEDKKPHRSTMPMIGHAAKAGTGPKKFVREVRMDEAPDATLGDVWTVEKFSEAEIRYVDITGTSKGRGFTGPMKRWGFGGQPATHGVERKHRSPGSIGGQANLGTGRGVRKGKKMGGHSGNAQATSQNHKLIQVDVERNLLVVKGSIAGPNGSYVVVREARKKR